MAAKKNSEEVEETTVLEEFLALDGADLVVAPNVLPPSKRARAYAVFAGISGVDDDGADEPSEEQMAALLNVSANALEWVEGNVVKNTDEYLQWAQGKSLDELMTFAFAYLRAVGEM